tara:strand:- start:2647 stop:5481 length:2835 start_codon:yes stop_codon:yes gene_type:complete
MPAITQRVDDYLGGVSRQSDDKKLPGQVEECINGYPDPTFGLTKRPGFQWIANLATGTTYDDSKWFYISRTSTDKYIGCITPVPDGGSTGAVAVWNAVTGAACTISYGTGAQAYLTGARTDYDVLTVQDRSIITNAAVTANKTSDPTFNANRQGTLVISGTSLSTAYSGTVAGSSWTATSDSDDTYSDALGKIKTAIDALSISGLTTTKLDNSIQLSRNASFTLTASGGADGTQLNAFRDQTTDLTKLPLESTHDHVVKILNTEGPVSKPYFYKFVADDGTSGPGYWTEGLDPSKSTGLDSSTVPHELVKTGTNAFTFQKITWTARSTGDDDTNPHPSFVGAKIQKTFFHNNRLGFLSEDNVSMSQSGEFYNLYHSSAQTVTDADPIDLSASTTRPVALHSVLPSTQGLVLFSANQQFLMFSNDGILTPSKTVIRAVSNYENDIDISPVDTGTTINFVSKTPSYTRIFAMVTRGENENPEVADIGKIINEWVPATVDTLISSAQNQFIALSGQDSKYIYFFRSYSEGQENLLQTWFNWLTPGTVQTMAADSDELYVVTKQNTQLTLSKANLSQSPDDAIIVNNDGQKLNPCIDLYATASSVSYDSTNEFSKCFIPYNDATDLTPVIVIKGTTATGQFIESGFTISPERVVESGNTYFKVPFKNLTSVASDVIVGYKYDFDVTLPKTYVRVDDRGRQSDFTANLTIARMKFAVGLSGVMGFKLKSKGIRQGKRVYTADGTTKDYEWTPEDFSFIDGDQIKVKINNVVSSAYTVSATASPLPKITLTSASDESKLLSGDGSTKVFDLTFTPRNYDIIKVKTGATNWTTASPVGASTLLTEGTDYTINNQYIHFTSAPASGTNNVLVYSADEIIIYLDEWYNLNPIAQINDYLANDIAVSDHTIFTLPIHQRTDNFTVRLFNDSPFPVSLNSMMWEGLYSPRYYRRT